MSLEFTVIIKSKTGKTEQLKKQLLALVKPTLKEKACIKYVLNQDQHDSGTFIIHEEWRDEDGFEAHNNEPHLVSFIEESAANIEGDITMYKTNQLHDDEV
jgi:quinol monooxygenase YgiN